MRVDVGAIMIAIDLSDTVDNDLAAMLQRLPSRAPKQQRGARSVLYGRTRDATASRRLRITDYSNSDLAGAVAMLTAAVDTSGAAGMPD
jgi:hypothetical protein